MTDEVAGITAEEAPKEIEKPTEKSKNDYELSGEPEAEVKAEEVAEKKEEAAKPKQKNGFKRKIARLEAEVARLSQSQPGQNQPQVKAEPVEGKPTPDKYPDYNEYLEALADYKADAKVKAALEERDKQAREKEQRKVLDTKRESFDKQKEELKKTTPDLDEVLEAYDDVDISPSLGAAILDSDMPVQVAYEIGKDAEEFKRLNDPKLGIIAINKAIARIEARLEKKEVKGAAVTTKAPPPIKPVTKSSSTSSGYSEDDSFEVYKQKRASGKI